MKNVSVRFPDDLHERLTEASHVDRRSLNSEVLWLLEMALDGRTTNRDAAR